MYGVKMQSELPEEATRLKALMDCCVLDTPPEELFDQTARHAAYVCGTPIGLIGFIDATRQWFKATVGWDYPEIPREDSICGQTILHQELVVISDAAMDERFFNGPMVTHAGIRFYAGVPLLTKEGYAVGTLCVMDRLPRELPAAHKDALLTLARLLETQLEVRRGTKSSAPDDKSSGIGGTVVNISESKRTDAALRDSQERLLGIISSAMDAIITVDGNQRIIVFNRAAEQIFRCPAKDALGQTLDKFIPQRFRDAHREHIRSFGQTGVSSRSMYSPGTLMGVREGGEEFPVEATISQVRTASETLFSVILRDISVRKRTEDEWRQAQKMEAVGHLAGGIAHEFNNYLGIIMGYSDLLGEEQVENDSLRLGLAEIKGATQKAASLTRQLLAFSRKQVIEPTVLDLNASIWEAHKLLRRLIPANIDVIPVLHPDLGKVKADPAQVQQILINLVVNARDAMPQGGRISIETAGVVLDEEFASRYFDVVPGEYIMISVSDNGEGIDAPTLPHIFEPFFTTKQAGKGTGLGLSTTYGIVKQSGGHITVASVRGRGTTFRIYFPKLAGENTPAYSYPKTTASSPPEPRCMRIATILIVEDESGLRKLMKKILEKHEYRVLEAKDGEEALAICQDVFTHIDLVVTDFAMPRMTGLQLREQLVALRPDMRLLLISGYAEEVVQDGPQQNLNGGDFLEKPFLPEELARKVREILSRVNGKHEEEDSHPANTSSEQLSDKSDTGTDPRLN
jgi:two-component system, cell cycle sensor histidine kinase and response regulator CckA